jgi:hypothetical protein
MSVSVCLTLSSNIFSSASFSKITAGVVIPP